MCALALPASAQPRGKADKNGSAKADKNDKGTTAAADKADAPDPAPTTKATRPNGKKDAPKTYDFNALDLNGRMRTPQLLYFLERANEELERASLEKRSFIPHMVRSVDEEAL
ncbi:MAG TPA: hypothetical protein VGO00_14605 [Kofleriaceae bacterium]|nr:hypothetical protein [Kofleriaceae bacterium]